ncbi:MAG: M48 family metalloprotease [Armatimonadota bacterium]|nr:M48 family metalloprotease [Armatimonadota bacterium]
MTGALTLIGDPAALRLGFALVHFVWQGAALAFIAVVLLAVLRKASANVRYLGLLLVFAAMAASPVVTLALAGDARAPIATAVQESIPRERPSPSLPPVADTQPPPVSTGLEVDRRPSSTTPVPDPWVARSREWVRARLPWITLLWLGGVVALSLRLLARWWAVGRVRGALESASAEWQDRIRRLSLSLSVRRPVRLLTSAASRVPMVIGWLRPVIVIPTSALTGLTPDQLAAILAHELAHIRRCDHFMNLAQTVVEILLFYHPAVWWVSSAIRSERENCCDDTAVRVSGDVVGYMRALAWIEQRRGRVPEAAIASSGTSLPGRIRRLAGAVSLPAGGYSWLAAAMALGAVMVLPITAAVSGLAAGPGSGHQGLGAREQWQPQLADTDARLQQPVHFEIIGRAAVPALAMLSEETGVSLEVAPENLDTVGERKLTIIAQGCSLKGLMVQTPKALQECHWDIDPSGPEPVYLLHRNGGADAGMAELHGSERRRRSEEQRPAFETRIAEVHEALAMSPEELKELEQSDLLLARAAQDPESRKWLELFASFPDDKMQELVTTGESLWDYFGDAPERFRRASRDFLEAQYKEAVSGQDQDEDSFDRVEFCKFFLDNLDNVSVGYQGLLEPARLGISLRLETFRKEGNGLGTGTGTVPPKFPDERFAYWWRKLLLRTGTPDEQTADALLAELVSKGDAEAQQRQERKREAEWLEPRSPALRRTITLPFSAEEPVDRAEVQRFIAHETGLSLVSDYFTGWGPRPIPEDARASMPAWRLLYLLGETWFWSYEWAEMGDCLVFHDRYWYRNAPRELPESLIEACREKLDEQGRFTLDDVVAIAQRLTSRRAALLATGGGIGNDRMHVPSDLQRAGLDGHSLLFEALLIYASLSPEQRELALSEEGLPYAEMTPEQRELVRQTHRTGNDRRPLPEEQIAQAVYCVRQQTWGEGSEARQYLQLLVVFPSREVGATLRVALPEGSVAAAAPD